MVSALIIAVFTYGVLDGIRVDYLDGSPGCFWYSGTVVYSLVVIVVNMYILKRTNTHTWVSSLLIAASILIFFIVLFLENLVPMFEPVYRIFPHIMKSYKFYLLLLLTTWACWAIDSCFDSAETWFRIRQGLKKIIPKQEHKESLKVDQSVINFEKQIRKAK